MEPDFLSERCGDKPMGVYLCHAGRIHVVFDFFDVCLCLDGFNRLQENVSNLLSGSGAIVSTYILRFACASISVRAEDLLRLREVLDEAKERIELLDLKVEAESSDSADYHVGAN